MGKKRNKEPRERRTTAPAVAASTKPRRPPYRAVLLILGLVLAAAGAVLYSRSDRFYTPDYSFGTFRGFNVLLITLDTTRADHLPAYGYKGVETPGLDRLAAESLIFDNAIAHVPLTLPSHTSILSGELPIRHGVRDNEGYVVGPKVTTLPEILKGEGYATAAFISSFVLDASWGLNRGFDLYFDKFNQFGAVNREEVQRKAEETEAEVERWLPADPQKPFFCWVHFYDPHEPYDPPEPYASKYASNRYDGEIAYMDRSIGRLFAKLQELRLADRTLVIVTGDHGEGLGEHGEPAHGMFLYSSTLRVPLLMRFPGGKSKRIHDLVGHIDLAPTILELLGVRPADSMQGSSLLPTIRGEGNSSDAVYSESLYAQLHYGWSPLASITTPRYELIESPNPELFDRKNDPRQLRNVIVEKPAIAESLGGRLREIVESFGAKDLEGPRKMDADTEEKLRSLGYLGSTVTATAESLKIDPKDKMQLVRDVNEGVLALSRRDYQRALELVVPVTRTDPNIVDAHYVAGASYANLQQYNPALEELFKVLALKPDHTMSLATLGTVYEGMGDLKQAEHWYLKVFTYEKGHPFTTVKLANLYRLMHQPEKAEEYFSKAIEPVNASLETTTDPAPRSRLYSIRAEMYFGADRLADAEADLKAAIALTPREPVLHFNLAQVYEKRNDVPRAIANYQQETVIAPNSFDAYMNLGLLHFRVQQFDAAASTFRRLMQEAPGDPRPALLLSETYLRMNANLDEALRLAQQGLQQIPDSPEIYALIGGIYKKLGRDREADEAFARSRSR